jgi:uncharacterized protein (DUF1330 family)
MMAKGYWIGFYKSVSDPARLAEYAKVAGPVIEAGGGRILARGVAAAAYESGVQQRTVLIEFDSVEQAVRTYTGPAYQAAFALLDGAADRDVRIVEGLT